MKQELQKIYENRQGLMDCVTRGTRGITENGLRDLAEKLGCEANTQDVYNALEALGKDEPLKPQPEPVKPRKAKQNETSIPDEFDSES